MILRRLAEAITEQNWFTVVLEVLIALIALVVVIACFRTDLIEDKFHESAQHH